MYWRDAIYLARADPFPMFAAWADGTVLVWFAGKPYRGHLPAEGVADLVKQARVAGLFDPPIKGPVGVAPDGPSHTLVARDGHRLARVSYGGIYDTAGALDRIRPDESPSRQQAIAFELMWRRTVQAVTGVAPDRLDRVDAGPRLEHPDRPAK